MFVHDHTNWYGGIHAMVQNTNQNSETYSKEICVASQRKYVDLKATDEKYVHPKGDYMQNWNGVMIFYVQLSLKHEKILICFKVPRPRPLDLLIKVDHGEVRGALVEWYWQGKNRRTRRKTWSRPILYTTNPTLTGPCSNPRPRGLKSARAMHA